MPSIVPSVAVGSLDTCLLNSPSAPPLRYELAYVNKNCVQCSEPFSLANVGVGL